jgi:hypothetical protein
MADFKIKNGLQVGKSLNEAVGTVTGNATLDLATGNSFSLTPTDNVTFVFSNPPATGAAFNFSLKLTGDLIDNAYDLANASYDSVSYTLNSFLASSPNEITFKPDGTMFFASQSDRIQQYSLTTAWDITTASYASVQLYTASQAGNLQGHHFKSDGSKFYFVSSTTENVYEYNLGTSWNLSTASYSSSFNFSSLSTNPSGLTFKSDGSAFYVSSALGGEARVFEFALSTAWDVTSASFVQSVDLAGVLGSQYIERLFFDPNGLNLFAIEGITFNAGYKIPLSSAWDITSTLSAVSFSFSNEDTNIASFTFKDDGLKMYALDLSSKIVYQYTTGTAPAAATFTYPASVKWPNGTPPAAPADGETDILTFNTKDGGTTWYGIRVGDDLS